MTDQDKESLMSNAFRANEKIDAKHSASEKMEVKQEDEAYSFDLSIGIDQVSTFNGTPIQPLRYLSQEDSNSISSLQSMLTEKLKDW